MKTYFVYILSNKPNGTLYTGVTNNLQRKILEHKNFQIDGFTKKYKLDQLVYFESCTSIYDAISHKKIKIMEKKLKNRIN